MTVQEHIDRPHRQIPGDAHGDFARLAAASRVLPPGGELVLEGPRLRKAEVDAAAEAAHRLFVALHDIFQQRFGGSIDAFGHATGHSAEEIGIYQWDGGEYAPQTVSRVDAVLTADGLKFVEFNIGSSVGGFEEASLRHLVGLPQQDPPIVAWGRYIACRVAPGSVGILIDDERALSDIGPGVQAMARYLSSQGDLTAMVCGPNDLSWDGQALHAMGRRVDWVYPLFFPNDVQAAPQAYAALEAAVRARRVTMPVPHSTKLFGSKLVLALLHEAAAAEPLASPLRQLVERWVAWTARFDQALLPSAIAQQQDLVLKPAAGLGGQGVVIGREQTPEAWHQALTAALAHPSETFALQRFHQPPVDPVVTTCCDDTGLHERHSYLAHSVWGLHVLDGQAAGTPFLRCMAVERSTVINQSRGAAVGAPPMVF